MPFTLEQEKQILDGLAVLPTLQTSLQGIGAQVGEYKGWLTRIDGEVKDFKKTAKPDDDKKPDEKPKPDWQQAMEKLQGDLQAEKNRNAVLAAVSKKEWFEPDVNADEILKRVVLKDGKLVVPGTKNMGGVEVAVDLTLDEAVQQLAIAKPFRVKANVKPGSGAGGSQADITEDVKYEDLMKDPKKLEAYTQKYPEKFAEIQGKALGEMLASKKK